VVVSGSRLFRAEAVEFHRQGGARGDVVQLTPRAFFFSHWLLLGLLGAGVWFAFAGRIDEYASGPAIVRIDGLHELTAPRAGVVSALEVAPGQHVSAGQALLRMHSSSESVEVETAQRELDDQLAKLLRDPADRDAREAVVSLRARRELAEKNLARQALFAPFAATIGDVRVQPGQLVEPGVPLLTLLGEQGGARLTALLPGRYRPRLARGMTLRFTADGFPREVHRLLIERVGDQIVGPSEALRFLGRDSVDAVALSGPVVLVDALLPAREFSSEGARYRFHHGMQGRAETAVRSDSIAFTFVPGLRQLVDHGW
jgi:multidrug efflux pump subunit AcrA (membrane-fusion protein)